MLEQNNLHPRVHTLGPVPPPHLCSHYPLPASTTSWPEGLFPSQSMLLGGKLQQVTEGMGFGVGQDSVSLQRSGLGQALTWYPHPHRGHSIRISKGYFED